MHLETKRLIIRRFTLDDLDDFALLMADPAVMRFSLAGPMSKEQSKENLQKRILNHYSEYGFGLFALIHKKEGKLIGLAGIITQTIDEELLHEVGYRLDPSYWKMGFATEATKAIAEYAFTTLKMDRLICIIDPKNTQSISVALRLGMHFWKKTLFHNIAVEIYALDKVALAPYDTKWPDIFSKEKEMLTQAFQGLDIDFFHMGSTSIPNCKAKPILDIIGATTDVLAVEEYNDVLFSLGFAVLGEYGMPGKRFFKRRGNPPINLHIFARSDPEVKRHLRFSNYLENHPEKMKSYENFKQTLALEFPHDIMQYTLKKGIFIKEIDRSAAIETPIEHSPKKYPLQKQHWNIAEILYAMHVNVHLQMTCFAKYIPNMEHVFEQDITVIRSSICDDMFNYVLFTKFTEKNAAQRIEHISQLFSEKKLPFSWWNSQLDTPTNLPHHLLQAGFKEKEVNIGMYKDLEDFTAINISPSLTIERKETKTGLKDFMDVITAIGGHRDAFNLIHSQIPEILYAGDSSFEMHVGYIDNTPAVTGMLVTHLGVAGIYYIATIPSQRKKGFGSSMMQHLLQRAKEKGYKISTLQASENGASIYRKIGFQTCCQWTEYSKF